jgi:hypothetical protein
MRHLRVLGLALLALFAVGAVASASASAALPQVLVGGVASAATFKGTSEPVPKLETLKGTFVECEKSASTTEIGANGESGTFHVTFSGKCHAVRSGVSAECTGLGDTTKGTILALGTVKFVYDKLGTELGVAAHLTLEPVHFECEAFGVKELVKVSGDLLCLITPINTLTAKSAILCKQTKGDSTELKYWETSEGTEKITSLLTATAEGTAESSGQETHENLVSFVGGVEKAVTLDG